MSTRAAGWAVIGAVTVFTLIQAIPYGHDHTNPPATAEPAWRTEEARAVAARACANCHSNTTVWPWYSHVAPVSWLVQQDVDRARRAMNFSEWDQRQPGARDAVSLVHYGGMPPRHYAIVNASAKLSEAERRALARDLASMLPAEPAEPAADDPPALGLGVPILGIGEW